MLGKYQILIRSIMFHFGLFASMIAGVGNTVGPRDRPPALAWPWCSYPKDGDLVDSCLLVSSLFKLDPIRNLGRGGHVLGLSMS